MIKDGFNPSISKENVIDEGELRSKLAHKLGITNTDFTSEYSGEGIYDSTLVFYDPIPPKYISVY